MQQGWLSVLIWFVCAVSAFAQCSETSAKLKWSGGNASFTVEVADDFNERAEGLMFRESMAKSAGMLFIYQRASRVSFWMKNTLIPLDILFFDESGTLVTAHENAIPLDETPIPGGGQIQYVLEVNAGLVDAFGIKEGAVLQHPGLVQENAAWPCP